MIDLEVWHVQLIGLAVLALLAQIIEKKAAMRGCHRNPLPPWFDRLLRVAFLSIVAGPTLYSLDKLLPFPILTPLLIAYLIPYSDLCEQRGGRTTLYCRQWSVFRMLGRRFSLQLKKTVDLPSDRPYIFGVHPHGILPFGGMIALGSEFPGEGMGALFPGINYRTLAATFCFYIPIYRDILLWGGVVDAARYSARQVLDSGKSLALVPGGATEALYANPAKDVVYIRKRLGFVKLALQTGASLVPVFSFNENNTFGIIGVDNPLLNKIRRKFQAIFGISLPLITNIIPRKTPITVVVGKPLACPKVDEPSTEMVQEYLEKYIVLLKELYETNREKYNDPPSKPPLEIM